MAKPSRLTPELSEEYRKRGYWEDITLPEMWDRNAREFPNKEALADSRKRLSWSQAKQAIDRLALGFLEMGMKRDDAMVVQLHNCVELVLLRVACAKAGIICAPALRTLRETEMQYVLKHMEAVAVVIPWKFKGFDYFGMIKGLQPGLPLLKHILIKGDEVPPGTVSLNDIMAQPLERKYPADYLNRTRFGPEDVSLVLLTTGTTGLPKFVEFPICVRLYSTGERLKDIRLTGDDIVGMLLPAGTGPNAVAYFGAPRVAAKVVILENFDAEEALKLIEREKVTCIGVVPTALAMMVRHPNLKKYDLSTLRLVMTDAASLPYQVGVEAESMLKCPVLQDYGTADYGGISMCSVKDTQEIRLLTAGKIYPGVEILLVDEGGKEVGRGEVGEIWTRGPTSVSAYYKDPLMTRQIINDGGWFMTGDLGKFDSAGNLIIAGRRKEMIIRGGQNIYPAEVENLLLPHTAIAAVAIVGMPDPVMGEKACAFVVLRPGQKLTQDEIVTFLKTKQIAPYKLPERLEILERLPLVGEQKVDKKLLVQDITAKLKAEGKI